MKEFPFDAVYEYFAKPLATLGLDNSTMQPVMFTARVADGKVIWIEQLPSVEAMFGSGTGKDMFGMMIRAAMAYVVDEPVCLVLVSEAYYKVIPDPENKGFKVMRPKGSLADDKDAHECIMISIYRPEETRMGTLFINSDRTLQYQPLHKSTSVGGRLSTHPDKEDLPDDITQH